MRQGHNGVVIFRADQGKGYVFKVAPDILLEAWALNLASFLEIKVPKFTVLDDLEDLVECLERTNSPEELAIIRSKLRHFSYSNMMVMELLGESVQKKFNLLNSSKRRFSHQQIAHLAVKMIQGYSHDLFYLDNSVMKTHFCELSCRNFARFSWCRFDPS